MITASNISKSFRIPKPNKRSIKGSLFSYFDHNSYQDIQVLDELSFQINTGECVGVYGPNGSGKSTLLKILAGVYEQDSGSVQIDGKLSAVLELGVGFNPELSGRENVLLNGLLLGLSTSKVKRALPAIFRFAELEDFIELPLKHYSSGMAARLAFAIATQVEADVYLFDEVLAVGDQAFQERCLETLQSMKKKGKTIVFVSHSQNLVEKLCNRVINLA